MNLNFLRPKAPKSRKTHLASTSYTKILTVLAITGVLVLYLLSTWWSYQAAKSIVEHAGYTNVRIADYTVFGAASRECWGSRGAGIFDFTATNASASPINVAVCCAYTCNILE